MGYNTDFKGRLDFAKYPTVPQLAALQGILGEDIRDHPEWPRAQEFVFIDLELTKDLMGVCWNGSEKTYGLCEQVNYVTTLMRKKWPDFAFMGTLNARGEEPEDHWRVVVDAQGIASQA